MRRQLGITAVSVTVAAIAYIRWFRPWQLTWGATADEVSRPLAGDDLVERPTFNATRAITIGAPPAEVWPWLVQVGLTRAGWYSYDILDNLGHRSSRQILPEFQDLSPGGIIPMSPDGTQGMNVLSMEPPHTMVWGTPGDTTWTWQLDDAENDSTRLLARVRARYHWLSPAIAFSALVEFGDIWMMRKMLIGIRDRAEHPHTSSLPDRNETESRSLRIT